MEPGTPQELAGILADAQASRRSITLGGNFSKNAMAGPLAESEVTVSTRRLNRVLDYEPRDLTISVEAGIAYSELSRVLAEQRQMIPLDPPFAADATIGGVLATNQSGPRRRLFGTARDMVIGMTFATLEGKLVQTGGMVVKNVAGLDMAKLMIGSFGTLAAMAVVNFKVHPIPPATRTFVRHFVTVRDAVDARDAVLRGVLQPSAIDLLKTVDGCQLALQAGGNTAVLGRYSEGLAGFEVLEGDAEDRFWEGIRELTPTFLAKNRQGAVVRTSCKLSEIGELLERAPVPSVARAGSGVVYQYFDNAQEAIGRGLIEFAPQSLRAARADELWPSPGDDFAMMEKIKRMFDPGRLLNRGRLYGRI